MFAKFTCILIILYGRVCSITVNKHNDNWAVLVAMANYWHNYHTISNILSIYNTVKRLGIPDDHIILMLADDMACNPRNIKTPFVYNYKQELNLYTDDIQVDYRGYEVTVENFINVLIGNHKYGTHPHKKMDSHENSNVLVYLDGHGTGGYLDFQGALQLSKYQLANTIQAMLLKKRYKELLLIIDSCYAQPFYSEIYSPNVIALASTLEKQKSTPMPHDEEIGVELSDKFSYELLKFFKNVTRFSNQTLSDLFKVCSSGCDFTVNYRLDLFKRNIEQVRTTDFFGRNYLNSVKLIKQNYNANIEKRENNNEARNNNVFYKYTSILDYI